MLVLSELSPEQRSQLKALGVPVAVVDPVGDLSHEVPAVGTTNWAGGLAATQHLIELGHTRIATISGPTCCAAGPGWTDTAVRLTRQG